MTETSGGPSGSVRVEELQSIDLLHWAVTTTEGEVSVVLDGEIDLSTGDALGELLAGVVEAKPARVVVDLEQVSFLDSTGVHRLLTAAHTAADAGCAFVVRNPSDLVMRVFTVCGVDEFLLTDAGQGQGEGAHSS